MRNQTACRIAPEHWDREAGTVTFKTKFGTQQTLPVTHELGVLFASVPPGTAATTPFIVALHPLKRLCATWPSQKFGWVRKQVGIERNITAHDLRRTTATAIYNQTRDLRTVQATLGHKQLATTLYYLDHRATPVNLSTLEAAKLPTKGIQ